MSTVPKADTPPPANNAKTHTISGTAGMYGRPANGGAPVAGKQEGNPPGGDAPAGATPSNPIVGGIATAPPAGSLLQALANPGYPIAQAGAPASTGDTQTGPNIGHGATQIIAEPNATGAPESATDGGTVGKSLTP